MENEIETRRIRVLCRKHITTNKEHSLQWLIGSPFLPPFTIISTFRCLHTQPGDPFSPDYTKESDDLRTLLLRGFDVIGTLLVGNTILEENARKAVGAARRMKKFLSGNDRGSCNLLGAVADSVSGDIRFFVSASENSAGLETINTVTYEDYPERYLSETGCFLHCKLSINLPIYFPAHSPSDAEGIFSSETESVAAKFKDPQVAFMIEGVKEASGEVTQPIILRGVDLDFHTDLSDVKILKDITKESSTKIRPCSDFCSKIKPHSSFTLEKSADTVQVTVLLNKCGSSTESASPIAEYLPASEPARYLVVSFKLDVLCYTVKDLPVTYAISKLIVPGLIDQLTTMKKALLPNLLAQHPQLHPYHFCPPGVVHPITVIYELSYGETEMKQVEIRRSLHLRLGLPLDRPLLLIANAINFALKHKMERNSIRKGSVVLKDVHIGIPSSVSGGLVSQVEGSYEYYHYLQDGFDDSGWGCAYRSLQTIISWFRLQHYTSIDVPSHREIQQALVEIGDKEPSFIGSREWIGAIELSFVLDKLLGVSCKVINVRSGAELPEKCRELALHFETQGTPVMIVQVVVF
ncbi:PREDICTED: probable Ufm1-specific protease isoform X3 [Nelumbo nucifera]|uniref:Ufm1-specific protease n=2 Tax=Nelumbo nucifera TaxID=4432 RepID=A0A822YGX9_NELNU|nr:PREDICTED: probable Ufm1-specific protease isoform X3 [Nelumbo nucifera]DAD30721.1 TPA_asm: hypothetical protein HUJ06_009572 [Nelumbo nucifera]